MAKTRRFTNKKTGESKLFTEINGVWIPAIEHEQKKLAKEQSGLDAFTIGAGKKVNDLVGGIKELFGSEDKYKKGSGYDALRKESPYATGAGEILSEIAQIALPAGAVTKGAKAIGAGRMSPVVGDLLASTGTAGLRGDDVLSEGLWSLGGSAITPLAKLVGRGARITPQAEKFSDIGGEMIPGQALAGGITTNIDTFLRNLIPGTAGISRRARQQADSNFHKLALKEAALPGTEITKQGTEGAKQVLEGYQNAYRQAWNSIDEIPRDAAMGVITNLRSGGRAVSRQGTEALKNVEREVADIYQKIADGTITHGDAANMIDGILSKHIGKADDYRLQSVLQKTKKAFRGGFSDSITYPGRTAGQGASDAAQIGGGPARIGNAPGPGGPSTGGAITYRGTSLQDKLAPIDAKYPQMLVVNDAAKSAASEGGHFTPRQLQISSERISSDKFGQIKGANPLQEIADLGNQILNRKMPEAPILSNIASLIRPNIPDKLVKGISDAAIGRTRPQKTIGKGIKKLEDLTLVPGLGAVGAAVRPEADEESEEERNRKLLEILGL